MCEIRQSSEEMRTAMHTAHDTAMGDGGAKKYWARPLECYYEMSEKLEIAEALGPESARCAACCFLPRLAWQPGNDEYRNRLVLMMTS